jgi:hypothetical protein
MFVTLKENSVWYKESQEENSGHLSKAFSASVRGVDEGSNKAVGL